MGSGWVLDFSDRTMGNFFLEELNIDIDDPQWTQEGTSKAKRLRFFLRKVDNKTAASVITALWNYRKNYCTYETSLGLEGRVLDLVSRLQGSQNGLSGERPAPAYDFAIFSRLSTELINISQLEPHARGYAFERFLNSAFQSFGMRPRAPFSLRGEQIDGSFALDNETYLLEAKWTSAPTGAADLHTFEGKLGNRAKWVRGLFVSYVGFTDEGLYAFGRAKHTVCMSGQDIGQALASEMRLDHLIREKVRKAAETGAPFTPFRDI